MSDISEQKKNLLAVVELGLAMQSMGVVVGFAVKKNRQDFLQKLNELVKSFLDSLTDEEGKELGGELKAMMEQKAVEFLSGLRGKMSEEEVEKVVAELKTNGAV